MYQIVALQRILGIYCQLSTDTGYAHDILNPVDWGGNGMRGFGNSGTGGMGSVMGTKSKMHAANNMHTAKFHIGQVVKHRIYPFRGVIFDVDAEFDNSDEWYESIPEEIRPRKNQPFYHLFAENDESEYVAYVSEQNLVEDDTDEPLRHPQVDEVFVRNDDGSYETRDFLRH